MAQETPSYPLSTIAKLLLLSEQRVVQLTKDGFIPSFEKGRYELAPAVQGYIRYLQDHNPSQAEIADWLGISQQAVSKQMDSVGIDYRHLSIKEVVSKYTEHLRSVSAQHTSADGEIDLTKERALKERAERFLTEIKLEEARGMVVNVVELENKYSQMVGAFKSELLSRDEKLKTLMFTVYGVDVDIAYLNEFTNSTLEHLSRYEHSDIEPDSKDGQNSEASGEADNNGVVKKAQRNKRKS